MGLTFTVHPNDAIKMLPSGNELTEHEKTVLTATKSYKASYAGMDRNTKWRKAKINRFIKPFREHAPNGNSPRNHSLPRSYSTKPAQSQSTVVTQSHANSI